MRINPKRIELSGRTNLPRLVDAGVAGVKSYNFRAQNRKIPEHRPVAPSLYRSRNAPWFRGHSKEHEVSACSQYAPDGRHDTDNRCQMLFCSWVWNFEALIRRWKLNGEKLVNLGFLNLWICGNQRNLQINRFCRWELKPSIVAFWFRRFVLTRIFKALGTFSWKLRAIVQVLTGRLEEQTRSS